MREMRFGDINGDGFLDLIGITAKIIILNCG